MDPIEEWLKFFLSEGSVIIAIIFFEFIFSYILEVIFFLVLYGRRIKDDASRHGYKFVKLVHR